MPPSTPIRRFSVITPLILATALSGCASKFPAPITGHTCCNLRTNGGWISSNNVQSGAFFPAGSSASLDSMKRDYFVYGTIADSSVGLRNDSSSGKEETLRWAQRLVVAEDPLPRLASWPQDVQDAVRAARVMVGMSREQVLMALSYPAAADTPNLQSPAWRYWVVLQDDEPVDIRFDADGRVQGFAGKPGAVQILEWRR